MRAMDIWRSDRNIAVPTCSPHHRVSESLFALAACTLVALVVGAILLLRPRKNEPVRTPRPMTQSPAKERMTAGRSVVAEKSLTSSLKRADMRRVYTPGWLMSVRGQFSSLPEGFEVCTNGCESHGGTD